MNKFDISVFQCVTLELKNKWDLLTGELPIRSFLHYSKWYEACCQSYHDLTKEKLLFILVEEKGKPIAIFPFRYTERKVLGIKQSILKLQGVSSLDLSDCVLLPDYEQSSLLSYVLHFLYCEEGISWDVLRMNGVQSGSSILRSAVSQKQYLTLCLKHHRSFYIPVDNKNEQLSFVSGKFRRNINRNRARLEGLGCLSYEMISGDSLNKSYEQFISIEASGWKGIDGTKTALKYDERQREFYQWLIDHSDSHAEILIALLKIDDDAVAGIIIIKVDGALYFMKMAYGDGYKQYAPGNILFYWVLKYCFESEEISEVNLITGLDWMLKWGADARDVYTCRLYNNTPVGFLNYIFDGMIVLIKLIKRYVLKTQ